jgi:hypothetical protein
MRLQLGLARLLAVSLAAPLPLGSTQEPCGCLTLYRIALRRVS